MSKLKKYWWVIAIIIILIIIVYSSNSDEITEEENIRKSKGNYDCMLLPKNELDTRVREAKEDNGGDWTQAWLYVKAQGYCTKEWA